MDDLCFPLAAADPASFTGPAHSALLAGAAGDAPTRVYYVRFQPGARTNWHRHTGTQILLVQEGWCRYQREGRPVEEHGPGSEIRIPPGVRHWHGAGPGGVMAHVAVNLENRSTEWEAPVSDEEYSSFAPV